jgi:hypothetical protein
MSGCCMSCSSANRSRIPVSADKTSVVVTINVFARKIGGKTTYTNSIFCNSLSEFLGREPWRLRPHDNDFLARELRGNTDLHTSILRQANRDERDGRLRRDRWLRWSCFNFTLLRRGVPQRESGGKRREEWKPLLDAD